MSGALEGYGALVTGGGTGIGHACAAALAADGAAVTICGRTETKLIDSAERANAVAGNGGSVRHAVADVTDEEAVAAVIATAAEPTGSLEVVIANAGGGGGLGPYQLQDAAEFRRVLDLNVVGTMLCVKHAVPLMQQILSDHYPLGGTIIRAMAARLQAGGIIKTHRDSHPSFHFGHRIHIPIHTNSRVRFMIEGRPYRLGVHYYARGPMGYGMGTVQVVRHDGRGRLRFDDRPFVVMNDGATVALGKVR